LENILGYFSGGVWGRGCCSGDEAEAPKSATRLSAVLASKLPKKKVIRLSARLNDSNSTKAFLILNLAV
jgi:hypothetical protein